MNETSAHIIGKAEAFQKVGPATGGGETPTTHNAQSVVNDEPIFYEDTPTHTHAHKLTCGKERLSLPACTFADIYRALRRK